MMMIEEVIKGKLIKKEDGAYTIKSTQGQEFPHCLNITSLKLRIGEVCYIMTFQDSKIPIILGTVESNVRDKLIEEVVNNNKNKIGNLENENKNQKQENEKMMRKLDSNKKFIEDLETQMMK